MVEGVLKTTGLKKCVSINIKREFDLRIFLPDSSSSFSSSDGGGPSSSSSSEGGTSSVQGRA